MLTGCLFSVWVEWLAVCVGLEQRLEFFLGLLGLSDADVLVAADLL